MQGLSLTASCLVAASAAVLVGCAMAPPPATEQAALAQWGTPTARHVLASGVKRLEYASGPMGRITWMLDLGPGGEVTRAQQVLTEDELSRVQAALPMPAKELLQQLGTPGDRRHGGWPGGQVWSWRYLTYQCLWFQVSVGDDGIASSGAFLPDPICDVEDNSL